MSRCAFRPKSLTQPGGATFLDPQLKVSEAELNRKQSQWATREQQQDQVSREKAETGSDSSSTNRGWLKKVKSRLTT